MRPSSSAALPVGMVILASLVAQSAQWEKGLSLFFPLGWIAVLALLTLVAAQLRLGVRFCRLPLPGQVVVVLTVLALPVLGQLCIRQWTQTGQGMETVLLMGVVVLTWLFLLLREQPRFLLLLVFLTLCLCVSGFSLSIHPFAPLCAGAYLFLAGLWLCYGRETRSREEQPPRRPTLVVLGLVVATFTISLFGPERTLWAARGVFLGSGGSDRSDPFGRGGVGEGEGEVAAQHKVDSVGFVNSDTFVESPEDSFYDAADEMKGATRIEAIRRKQTKKIFIQAARVKFGERKLPKKIDAAKEFSTLRRPPARSQDETRAARVVLTLKGRTPVHLRLHAYDRFDGLFWYASSATPSTDAVTPLGRHWLQVNDPPPFRFVGAQERYELKLGLLSTRRLPLPNHTEQFRIGEVSRSDFYQRVDEDLLQLDLPEIPGGTTIEVLAPVANPARLWHQHSAFQNTSNRLTEVPISEIAPEALALAHTWTRGVPHGWPQVDAVVTHLRRWARHVPESAAPAHIEDTTGWFLLKARQGPDYLFASAAAVLLRSLGYETRLVSGFYARPERFDRKRQQTEVLWKDIHYWVEVRLTLERTAQHHWVAIEPTPGYALLTPRPTWSEQLQALGQRILQWMIQQALPLAALLALGGIAWWQRVALCDAGATLRWFWNHRQEPVRATLTLLETRARLAGRPRPPSATLWQWYGALPDPEGELQTLLQAAMVTFYGGGASYPPERGRLFVAQWRRQRLQEREVRDDGAGTSPTGT